MKYVALVYSNPGAFEALSPTERDELMSEADAFLEEFTASGELLSGGVALADPSIGKTVRVRHGLPAVTDVEPGEWYDPAFLSQIVGASVPISLAPGEKKTQDIKLAGGGGPLP